MVDFEKVEQQFLGTDENDKVFYTICRKLFYSIINECITELFIKKGTGEYIKLSNYALPSIDNTVQNVLTSYALMLNMNGNFEYTLALCRINESKDDDAITPLGVITLGSLKEEKMFISYAAYSLSVMLLFYMQTALDLATIK